MNHPIPAVPLTAAPIIGAQAPVFDRFRSACRTLAGYLIPANCTLSICILSVSDDSSLWIIAAVISYFAISCLLMKWAYRHGFLPAFMYRIIEEGGAL
jgi:hypothetical protein